VLCERLSAHTSLRVGGCAQFFGAPDSQRELQDLLCLAEANELPWIPLGAGTNLLFGNQGYDGLVIQTTRLHGRSLVGGCLRVGAGELLRSVAWSACEAGLSGLEWAVGIPGTIGGAVAMNAGAYGGQTADVLLSVESVTAKRATIRTSEELSLGYRTSAYRTGALEEVVVEATLQLARSTPAQVMREAERLQALRRASQPIGATAGSVFRNPLQPPTAGQLLDRAGCKGMRVGRAVVSAEHANVIVNEGSDNAADVLALIDRMKACVREVFGVDLEEEIVIVDSV